MKILNFTEFINEAKSNDKNFMEQLIDYLKNKNYENYVETLEKMLQDPKLKNLIDAGFGGEFGNIKLKMQEKIIPVKNLSPTQNEIGMTQSLDYGLKNPECVGSYFHPTVEIVSPLITLNGKYVIDGHHRWSQIIVFNPDAKAVCLDFRGNITPEEMLKITQGSIAATTGELASSKKQGGNLYDMPEKEVRDHIEDTLEDSVFYALKAKDGKKFVNREDVVDYLVDGCKRLVKEHPILKNAPNRGYMPQTSEEPIKNMAKNVMTNIK